MKLDGLRIPYKLIGSFKGALFLSVLVLIISVFLYTNRIVTGLRENSRRYVSLKVERFKDLFQSGDEALEQYIKEMTSKDFPLIVADSNHNPSSWSGLPNLDQLNDSLANKKARNLMNDWMNQGNQPLPLNLEIADLKLTYYFYYGDSDHIRQLRFLPWVEFFLGSALILIGYLGFVSIKKSEERSVWVGMARETAHQMGTPLTSLLGWIELLKEAGRENDEILEIRDEMKSDILRLNTVAERFQRIGSKSVLKNSNLHPIIAEATDYIKNRLPQLSSGEVSITQDVPSNLTAEVNKELFSWVLENLLRNGVESLQGKGGDVKIVARQKDSKTIIEIADTGIGISRSEWRNIFRPGYSTKKYGWGLGLSLARRIVTDVHFGKINVIESKVNRGTTFRIKI